jgi:5-methylcytosine-specific restriction endonuclease McrA
MAKGRSYGWTKLRAECFRRDRAAQAECWICHGERGPIDYDARPGSTPLSYAADHVLPVSTHPELELVASNVRASHAICNRMRGNRAGVDVIGQRSRQW